MDTKRITTISSGVSISGAGSAAVAFIVLSASPSGLSPLSAAVSQWALTPFVWGYQWFTISLAVAAVALAVALVAARSVNATSTGIALLLFAFGRSFVGWVNMDSPGAAATVHGDIHWILGTISFLSMIAAMLVFARARHGRHTRLMRFSEIAGWITLGCVVLFFAATRISVLSAVFGLFERGFYIIAIVWITSIGIVALRGRIPTAAVDPLR